MSSQQLYNAVQDLNERMDKVEELVKIYMGAYGPDGEAGELSLTDQLKGSHANKIHKRQKKTNRG